jgi:putative membrane protein
MRFPIATFAYGCFRNASRKGTFSRQTLLHEDDDMDRRSLMTMAALTLAAPSAVLARHRTRPRRSEEEASQGEASSTDVKYAQQTLAVGAIALATSQLAQSMAKDDWVKRFANYEVAEQTTVAEVLKSLGMKPEESNQPADAASKLKSSKNFDSDFLAAQLDGHQQLLKIQDDYIAVAKDPAHVGLAKLARTQIKEHIDLIQTIQKTLKT